MAESYQHFIFEGHHARTAFKTNNPEKALRIVSFDNEVKSVLFTTQSLLGDALVVRCLATHDCCLVLIELKMYRCYVVWNSFWSVALPVLTWICGKFIFSVPLNHNPQLRTRLSLSALIFIIISWHIREIFHDEITIAELTQVQARYSLTYFAMTLVTNLLATCKLNIIYHNASFVTL